MMILASELRSQDVLFGRSNTSLRHPGNICFKALIDLSLDSYMASHLRAEKTSMVVAAVSSVEEAGGRFLKKATGQDGAWLEVDEKVARNKVSHAFRDGLKLRPVDREVSRLCTAGNLSFSAMISMVISIREEAKEPTTPTHLRSLREPNQEHQDAQRTPELASHSPVMSRRIQCRRFSLESQRPSMARNAAIRSSTLRNRRRHSSVQGQGLESLDVDISSLYPSRSWPAAGDSPFAPTNATTFAQYSTPSSTTSCRSLPSRFPEAPLDDDFAPLPCFIGDDNLSSREEDMDELDDVLEAIERVQMVMDDYFG